METDRAPRWLVVVLTLAIVLSLAGLCAAPHHHPVARPTVSSVR